MSKLPISERKRIERAKAIRNHILVGVDPACHKHTAVIYSPDRMPVGKVIDVKNRRYGFEYFEQRLSSVRKQYPDTPVTLVIEASGEYWKPMQHYFEQRAIETIFVPPLFVKRTRDLDDYTPRSNDPKDSIRIANLAIEGRYFSAPMPTEVFENLKQLVRLWDLITDNLTRCRHRIKSHLVKYFPEFSSLFRDVLGVAAMIILERWPFPHELVQVSQAEICEIIRQHMGNGHVDKEKVKKLLALAHESIGVPHGTDGARMRLVLMLEQVKLFKKQLAKLRQQIRQTLGHIDYAKKIQTIHGIGTISTAQFLGYLGDLDNFDKVNQVLDIAGLTLIATESGTFKSQRQISHRGRSALRWVLYEMTLHFLRTPNTARRKYLKCRLNGKKHRQAVVAAIPHLVKTIFAVVKQNRTYTPLSPDDQVAVDIKNYEKLLQNKASTA